MEFSEGLSKQQKISEIMRNSNLSATEKQNQIALILSDGERLPEEEVIECTHYSNEDKKCGKCFFECCQKYDNCHRCHKESGCTVSPARISSIECNECKTRQPPSRQCINTDCGLQFSRNYCGICKLWTAKDIFHCDDCGFCRVGVKESNYHCHSCNACYHIDARDGHICTIVPLDQMECAVCLEGLHANQKATSQLPCRHAIHHDCYKSLLENGEYRCPSCRKSTVDMKPHWERMRVSRELQPMPAQYQKKVDYICYDCSFNGKEASFHFVGVECTNCGSFNTSCDGAN